MINDLYLFRIENIVIVKIISVYLLYILSFNG